MRQLSVLVIIITVGLFVWGCVEDLDSGGNHPPKVWYTRGPDEGQVIFTNSVDFEWMATDWDDDLGMGEQYVMLDPHYVEWYDEIEDEYFVFEHQEGWVRVYDTNYQVLDLPDETFHFTVRIVDAREAETELTRKFIVRFDDMPPVVDSVACPPAKPSAPNFTWKYVIYAHDVARSPRNATPVDSLEYSYRFKGPAGTRTYDSDPEWATQNREFEVTIDGQTYPGDYVFKYKVRDRAMNATTEFKCDFTIE